MAASPHRSRAIPPLAIREVEVEARCLPGRTCTAFLPSGLCVRAMQASRRLLPPDRLAWHAGLGHLCKFFFLYCCKLTIPNHDLGVQNGGIELVDSLFFFELSTAVNLTLIAKVW